MNFHIAAVIATVIATWPHGHIFDDNDQVRCHKVLICDPRD